jgi:hypothetical protein
MWPKMWPKMWATSVIFTKLSTEDNHPMSENAPNLVTLLQRGEQAFKRIGLFSGEEGPRYHGGHFERLESGMVGNAVENFLLSGRTIQGSNLRVTDYIFTFKTYVAFKI